MPIDLNDPRIQQLYGQPDPNAPAPAPVPVPPPAPTLGQRLNEGVHRALFGAGLGQVLSAENQRQVAARDARIAQGGGGLTGALAEAKDKFTHPIGVNRTIAGHQLLAPDAPKTEAAAKADDAGDVSFATPAPTATQAQAQGDQLPRFSPVTSRTIDKLPPAIRKQYDEANDLGKAAVLDQYNAETQLSGAKVQNAFDKESALRGAASAKMATEKSRDDIVRMYQDEQRDMVAGIKQQTIDPSRYFHSQGTWGNITNLIGVMLGAYAAPATGGRNMAAEAIQRRVDADIEAQKANLQNRKDALGESKSILAQRLQQFGDMRAAEDAARSDLLNAVVAHGEGLAEQSNNPAALAKFKANSAQLLKDSARNDERLLGYQQTVTSGGAPDVSKRVQELRDKAAANGVDLSPEQARQAAYSELGYGTYSGPGYAKGAPQGAQAAPLVQPYLTTTSGHPVDAHRDQVAVAAQMQSIARQVLGRGANDEQVQALMPSLTDTEAMARHKTDAFNRMIQMGQALKGKGAQPNAERPDTSASDAADSVVDTGD